MSKRDKKIDNQKDEGVRVFNSIIACKLGLNQAIVISQIHYWINKTSSEKKTIDGLNWVYNSIYNWLDNLPFFSESTFKRTIKDLKAKEILKQGNFKENKNQSSIWYTLNYGKIEELTGVKMTLNKGQNDCESDDETIKMTLGKGQNDCYLLDSKSTTKITNTRNINNNSEPKTVDKACKEKAQVNIVSFEVKRFVSEFRNIHNSEFGLRQAEEIINKYGIDGALKLLADTRYKIENGAKTNKAGFLYSIAKHGYIEPVKCDDLSAPKINKNIQQYQYFEQRTYSDDEFNNVYENSKWS